MSYKNLTETKAHSMLKQLSGSAFDLTKQGVLSKDRIHNLKVSAGGLNYYYAMQRVDEKTLDALQELANESDAVGQYKKMLQGETLNKIEGFELSLIHI